MFKDILENEKIKNMIAETENGGQNYPSEALFEKITEQSGIKELINEINGLNFEDVDSFVAIRNKIFEEIRNMELSSELLSIFDAIVSKLSKENKMTFVKSLIVSKLNDKPFNNFLGDSDYIFNSLKEIHKKEQDEEWCKKVRNLTIPA